MLQYSVLLSVYHKENPLYLRAALDSIFYQTLLPTEVILVEDGSLTDELESVISSYNIPYMKIIKLPCNKGLSNALNEGLKYCNCEYVGRMDSDDICIPNRFEVQMSYLEKHPEIDVIGAFATVIDEVGNTSSLMKVPLTHHNISRLVWTCPFIHPTVVYKKSKICEVGGYDMNAGIRQDDYDLWLRCAQAHFQFDNIDKSLLYYRILSKSICKNGIRVGWDRLKVGIKGCWRLKLSFLSYIGVTFPFFRALLPYPLNLFFNRLMNYIDPRKK